MEEMRYEIPQGVEIEVENNLVTVKAGGKETRRKFTFRRISIKKADKSIVVSTNSIKKADYAVLGTVISHINNMVKGVRDGFTYRLKVVYSHFPMTVAFTGNIFSVSNFLGEKVPRKVPIPSGVEITIKGQEIVLNGVNKEDLGIAASRIEQLCKITNRDRRIFQDGIYIIEKDSKSIL